MSEVAIGAFINTSLSKNSYTTKIILFINHGLTITSKQKQKNI